MVCMDPGRSTQLTVAGHHGMTVTVPRRAALSAGAAAFVSTLVLPSAASHASIGGDAASFSIELEVDDDRDGEAQLTFFERQD